MGDKDPRRALSDIMWQRPDGSVCENERHQWSGGLVCDDCALWFVQRAQDLERGLNTAMGRVATIMHGREFGRLRVIGSSSELGVWFCRCLCGNAIDVPEAELLGNRFSCGTCGPVAVPAAWRPGGRRARGWTWLSTATMALDAHLRLALVREGDNRYEWTVLEGVEVVDLGVGGSFPDAATLAEAAIAARTRATGWPKPQVLPCELQCPVCALLVASEGLSVEDTK